MVRNAVQMFNRVLDLVDRTRNRYADRTVIDSINEAIELTVTKRIEPIKTGEKYSLQSTQRVREELAALIPDPVLGIFSSDTVEYPSGYKSFLQLNIFVGDNKIYCKPTNYNQIGDLKLDPFGAPSDDQFYFNETKNGLIVYHGESDLTSYELWYIKNPVTVSIGEERDKLITAATLTNAVEYYVFEESVYSANTYYPGEIITGTGAALTSGVVIISTKIVNSELSSALQDEVCNLAAALLSGQVEDYYKKQSLQQDADKY